MQRVSRAGSGQTSDTHWGRLRRGGADRYPRDPRGSESCGQGCCSVLTKSGDEKWLKGESVAGTKEAASCVREMKSVIINPMDDPEGPPRSFSALVSVILLFLCLLWNGCRTPISSEIVTTYEQYVAAHFEAASLDDLKTYCAKQGDGLRRILDERPSLERRKWIFRTWKVVRDEVTIDKPPTGAFLYRECVDTNDNSAAGIHVGFIKKDGEWKIDFERYRHEGEAGSGLDRLRGLRDQSLK